MKRPPPYFPQNQLSPPDEGRYKRLKFILGAVIAVVILVMIAAGYGIYHLILWATS